LGKKEAFSWFELTLSIYERKYLAKQTLGPTPYPEIVIVFIVAPTTWPNPEALDLI
jgi:hypothetical protein